VTDFWPFRLKSVREPLNLWGIEIPCYGSLTVEEAIAWDDFRESEDFTTKDLAVEIAVCTWLLRRVDLDITPEIAKQLPLSEAKKALDFWISELRQWQDQQEETNDPKSESTGALSSGSSD